MVGISCMHALEYDRVLETAREVRRAAPDAFILVGGHAAAAFPGPLEAPEIDAICVDDGEEVVPAVADALGVRAVRSRTSPRCSCGDADGWTATRAARGPDGPRRACPLPARDLVERDRNRYHCLLFKPVWLVETARGCPFRCSFCSVWQLYGRSFRERSIGAVVEDIATVGDAVFIADDLFWNHPERSLELAEALKARGVRKRWILVQTRTDLVCRHAELLEAWRPLAKDFDIFFGLEAASDAGLASVDEGRRRRLVDRGGADLALARLRRHRATSSSIPTGTRRSSRSSGTSSRRTASSAPGYTILTPLPGTELFQKLAPILEGQPWFKYDMHHVLWEPRLGAKRFFELYAETWRRSILNTSGEKSWIEWMRQVRPAQIPYLTRVLMRTQRMMKAQAYLKEHEEAQRTKAVAPPQALEAS